jgi:malate dehydrogenase (oxaloacetate-decarboxylating)
MKAIEEGVARVKLSRDEIYKKAEATIRRSQQLTKTMMKEGLILPPP